MVRRKKDEFRKFSKPEKKTGNFLLLFYQLHLYTCFLPYLPYLFNPTYSAGATYTMPSTKRVLEDVAVAHAVSDSKRS